MSTDEGGDPACWAHLFEESDDEEPDDGAELLSADDAGSDPVEPADQ